MRAWTVQLALESRAPARELVDALARLAARDPSPIVRLYLASGLQRLPVEQRLGIARGLVSRAEDAQDQNIPLVTWYGIEPLVAAEPEHALVLAKESRIEKLTRFLYRRAAYEPGLRAEIVRELASEPDRARLTLILDEVVQRCATTRAERRPTAGGALCRASQGPGAHPRQALE